MNLAIIIIATVCIVLNIAFAALCIVRAVLHVRKHGKSKQEARSISEPTLPVFDKESFQTKKRDLSSFTHFDADSLNEVLAEQSAKYLASFCTSALSEICSKENIADINDFNREDVVLQSIRTLAPTTYSQKINELFSLSCLDTKSHKKIKKFIKKMLQYDSSSFNVSNESNAEMKFYLYYILAYAELKKGTRKS